MCRERSRFLGVGLFATVLVALICPVSLAWFAVPPPAGVTTLPDTQDAQLSSAYSPSNQAEWQLNFGGNSSIRLKGAECPSLFKWDLSAYKGQQVVAAELHLARSNTDILSALAASTVNTDWSQGTVCYRYRALPGTEWCYPHSDATCVTFGNFGTLTCFSCSADNTFRSYSYNGYTWVAMVVDPDLIYAMILDNPGGLAVTDSRYHSSATGLNPSVYAREAGTNAQPRLFIQFAPGTDTTPPTAVGSLSAAGGMDNGSVILSFTAPTDPDDAGNKAFGYNVKYSTGTDFNSATAVDRWRIARPKAPGAGQRVLIEGLTPGTAYNFFVQAYDRMGNNSPVASVAFTLPATVATPTLADGGLATPDPTGKSVRTDSTGTVMRYFAASEVAKISPATGDLYGGTAGDDYKKANMVWDAGTNTISLLACRNEMIGAQVVLQRLGSTLSNVSVAVSNLAGPAGSTITADPNVELFQLHNVADSGTYPEAAIPLFSPFPTTFSIPDINHNAGGTYQSVWMDLYVPQNVNPGDYTGTVTVTATELSGPVTINLKLHVSSLMIPDYPTFLVDLNGYGNPWDFGASPTMTCLKYFQVCHKHRAVCNTLPYGWSGNVQSDRCPSLTGAGPTAHANSWSTFDNKYGWLFSGTAFTAANGYTGPGVNTPITHFYTTFNEGWPVAIMDPTYGFDAAGSGPTYWDNLKNTAIASGLKSDWALVFPPLPDLYVAFPSGYKTGHQNVIADWVNHAHAKGWTKTAFEIYFNEKFSYSGAHVFWTMEENDSADDFYADGYYHGLYRQAYDATGVTDVPWHFRIDISDRYGQNWGQLDNRVNWWDLNSGAAGWHFPQKYYRQFFLDSNKQEGWMWYGLGAPVNDSGKAMAKALLQKWCQGFDAGLPWWDSFNTNWTTADDNTPCVIYSGNSVPGYGQYAGPIMSIRVKETRQVEQIIELLNLWAGSGAGSINRNRVRDAINAKYGAGTWDYSFSSMDENRIYKLRADLIAQLEPVLLPATPSSPNPADGATGVSTTPTLSWAGAAAGVTFDVYLDTVNPPVTKVATSLSSASYTPATLVSGLTCYWRIVATNNNGSTMGPVWSFTPLTTTPPAMPASPSPGNGQINVPVNGILSWSAAAPGVTFDVYVDTANPPHTRVATGQTAASFSPALADGTRYYWQVVASNMVGPTPGPVWSFATHLIADIDGDGAVNLADLKMLIVAWNSNGGGGWGNWNPSADLDGDNSVNLADLKILIANWNRHL